jgi:hypothetical protein
MISSIISVRYAFVISPRSQADALMLSIGSISFSRFSEIIVFIFSRFFISIPTSFEEIVEK